MNYFKKILRFAKPYKKYAVLNIIANVFYALFSALSFIALIPMLDVLFNGKDATKITEPPVYNGIGKAQDYFKDYLSFQVNEYAQDDVSIALILVISLVIVLFFLKNISNYIAMYFITFLRNGTLKDLRNALYKKTIELPLSHYSEKRKGDTIARITSDVLEIQHSFLSILELIVREPLTILFTIGAMLFISPELTVFVFIFIPISGFIISLIGKSLKKKSDKVQQEQGLFLSILEETLGGLKIIKGFNAESIFYTKFKSSTQNFNDFSNKLLNRQNLASPASEFLGISVIAVLLWYGGTMVLVGETLDGPMFIAYMGLAYNVLTPAKGISKAFYNVKKGNAAAERVLEILETENSITDADKAIDKTEFNSELTLENISFKYENEYVLKNFQATVKKGKTVALVGQSGSGKSTIANLVTRFYDIAEGEIKIDGINIKDMSQSSLRGLMGLVTQDSILFNDTIKENLKIGKPNATDEELIASLKIANAYEFVKELPKGMDTNIGDSGGKLSGGQKQRLSIARAVLKNPPIMILDEATSALDTESEQLVQKALENMMKNRTSIVIAHRLSTIKNADTIIVMHQGEIVEQGRHDELIANKGVYKKLVNMQSFE
ncbi:lipid A export ATP-type exporter binding/permease components MsbA [Psychroflexus gondwanensis ACAM 44]|uniref:Lipid A export ATP-type exporter binding/permease components MsbA n=1 Tax=Psychroflexus gondwanensis ACAM 44 TaxID=1189619 RepID=N1WYC8_9FLAO|nr:ABC transporter ATP-binding protein [Psychroflexus gondwanensis]EMY82202.1 lipid A export ATP-type exporter binding/permease components MsbA [Psychroflexus gondwanensis ACAM 44]